MYLMSIGAGILVGVIYALINVRSPAPPVIALLGLLGMLIGEQMVPIAKRVISGEPVSISWLSNNCIAKISGIETPPPSRKDDVSPPGV